MSVINFACKLHLLLKVNLCTMRVIILLNCMFCCVYTTQETFIVNKIFNEWLQNFKSIDALSKFSKTLQKQQIEDKNVSKKSKKLFALSDMDDFTFSGVLTEQGLPNGYGVIDNLDVEMGSRDYCFKGRCQKSVVGVVGTFNNGLLNGVGEVYFSDGSFVRGEFNESSLHGLYVEFDTAGRHTYTGRYSMGR